MGRGEMKTRTIDIFLLGILCTSLTAGAQPLLPFDAQVETAFKDAVRHFESYEYRQANRLFQNLVSRPHLHHRTTAAYLMAARSAFLISDPDRCIALLREFLQRFPGSTYTQVAHEFLADAHRRTGDDYLALVSTIRAYRLSRLPADRAWYLDGIGAISQSGLRLRTLINALDEFRGDDIRAVALMQWAEVAWDAGEQADALEAFRALPPVLGDGAFAKKRLQLAQKFGVPIGAVSVAIVLPAPVELSMANDVRDFKDGVLTAIATHRDASGIEIEPAVHYAPTGDSMRSLVDTLVADGRVVGIIGGVFPDDAFALAKAAGRHRVPCLIAATVQDSLPSGSAMVFQLTATARTRGELLARYIAATYPGWNVAVLAQLENPARDIAQGFVEALKQAGRPPTVVSWYSAGSADLRTQFRTVTETLGSNDSLAVLFAPISAASAIPVVLSGYHASGLRSLVVGSGEWDHPEVLDGERVPTRPIIFESEYYLAGKDPAYRRFEYAYLVQTKRLATLKAVFGYDASMCFLSALSSGSLEREHIGSRLRAVRFGLRGPLAFPARQTNQGITVYRYEDRVIHKHATIPEE